MREPVISRPVVAVSYQERRACIVPPLVPIAHLHPAYFNVVVGRFGYRPPRRPPQGWRGKCTLHRTATHFPVLSPTELRYVVSAGLSSLPGVCPPPGCHLSAKLHIARPA